MRTVASPAERARLELGHARRQHGGANALELLERLVVPPRFEQRVRTRERGVDAAALVGRDAVREKARVDAEPLGKPLDRLAASAASCRARSG